MANAPTLPAWIRYDDGRLEAFDGDRIAQRLYRTLADSGRDDPLLSRELADGVLHFLAAEQPPALMPSADLSEHIVKIVRELGHPDLARALAARARAVGIPQSLGDERPIAVAAQSSCEILPRDIDSAIASGLLVALDLGRKTEMLGGVIRPISPGRGGHPGWIEALIAAGETYRSFVALDGPEWLFAESDADVWAWLREFRAGLSATDLCAVVNLNATAPPWISWLTGPLFHDLDSATRNPQSRIRKVRRQLVTELIAARLTGVRIDWHYTNPDCWTEADRAELIEWLRAARRGAPIVFVPDREPDRPALAEGIDRAHPELLGAVGIRWRRLEQRAPASDSAQDAFRWGMERLPHVVSLAASLARSQRRRIVDRADHPLQSARRLDRARFLIVPLETAASSGPPDRVDGRMRLIVQALSTSAAEQPGVAMACGATPPGFPDSQDDWAPDVAIGSDLEWHGGIRAAIDASGLRAELVLPPPDGRDPEPGLAALAWAFRSTRVSHVRLRRAAVTRPLALDW